MADANAASCSSSFMPGSASTSSSRQYYDVFINHRGPDAKAVFATPLYDRLTTSGLQVFLDKPEMEVGHGILPQIEDAIKVASIYIAIFSQRYAESQWCLDELVSMLNSGKTIIPVFYGVKPEHLRWTGWTGTEKDGSYAKALHHHEEKGRHSTETIQQWRKALSHVADTSGLELEAFNGDENKLLDKLVQNVLRMVPRPLDVAKYPTGLGQKLEEFKRRVLSQQQAEGREEAKVVGIWGLGGAGKTTLAKHFFNHERSKKNYEGFSFLFDVRDKTSRGNLTSLQCNLIKDLKGKDIKIDSVEEGICKLKDNLSSSRFLVILDDVDHVDQLDAFLPLKDVLNPNSLIVVTTRDKRVLRSANISEPSIYHLRGLNQSQSRQLFCSHAFPRLPDPPPGFKKLVIRFVKACDGLPLSLKVLGALLCGENDISYWEGVLDGLSKLLPKDIESRLRISYDSLGEEEKEIFLDIACFGQGENESRWLSETHLWHSETHLCQQTERDKWLHMWGRSGLVGFRNLQNKCLVEVDDLNKMRMHDHVRDMGRNIAERSMARRLWQLNIERLQDINKLLKQSSSSSDITEVRGIRIAPYYIRSPSHEVSHEVCRMRGLKFLEAEGDFVERILNRVESPELRWLRWHRCPCPCLPSSIPMNDLRVLEVYSSELKMLWDCDSQVLVQLRELYIKAPIVELPNSLGQLKLLEKIKIWSSSLETFPEEFNLPSLKYLTLLGCKFKRLWKSEGPLRLRELYTDAPLVEFPESLGQLKDLQVIKAYNTYLTKGFCYPPIIPCRCLPTDFCYPPSLQNLKLEDCEWLALQDFQGVSVCGSTKVMEAYRDTYVKAVETSTNLGNVRSLLTYGSHGLKMVPSFLSNLTNLQKIKVYHCSNLKKLPEFFGNLKNLEHIHLEYCPNLKKLPNSFGNLCQLKHLHLKGCRKLTISNETLGNIRSLVCLDLKGCVKMESLPHQVGRQQRLEKLDLLDTKLKELPCDLVSLSSLEFLRVGTPLLEMLPPSLGCLTSLKQLWLDGCEKLQYLPDSVELLSQLTELKIRECRKIEYLPAAVMRMKNLKVLAVFDCPLRELPFKSQSLEFSLLQLEELLLYRTEVSEVSFPNCVCANLEDLSIVSCRRLVEVGELPRTLKRLDISDCDALRRIRGIYGVAELEELDMRGCKNIEVEELQGLEALVSSGLGLSRPREQPPWDQRSWDKQLVFRRCALEDEDDWSEDEWAKELEDEDEPLEDEDGDEDDWSEDEWAWEHEDEDEPGHKKRRIGVQVGDDSQVDKCCNDSGK